MFSPSYFVRALVLAISDPKKLKKRLEWKKDLIFFGQNLEILATVGAFTAWSRVDQTYNGIPLHPFQKGSLVVLNVCKVKDEQEKNSKILQE